MSDFIKQILLFSTKSFTLLILITIFAAFGIFVIVEPAISKLQTNHEFTADGLAKKSITPDIAYVNISAVFSGTNAGTLKKDVDKAINDTVTGLKSLSSVQITEEMIKTNYTINPKYDKDGQNIIGYTATPTLEVKTRDFTVIDKVIEVAQANKMILVNNVYFTLEDPVKAKEQLREEAIANAKAKAEKVAAETGLRLGKIVNISENNYVPYYSYQSMDTVKLNSPSTSTSGNTGTRDESSTINPGQTEIQLTVYITYEIN